MADLQEIIKTHTKSYPSYLDTYPRNGKTTVGQKFDFFLKLPVHSLVPQTLLHSRILHIQFKGAVN